MSDSVPASPSIISPKELRAFAGHFATGVAVVTAAHSDGSLHGLTLNAVTSLSLDPPLFLVCLDHKSNTLAALRASGHFGLHFLSCEQTDISQICASKLDNKFENIRYRPGLNGSPLIEGVVAAAECSLANVCPGGDHTIIIGAVDSIHVFGGEPLLYHCGGYTALKDKRMVA
jgi:flavin reductase (DIM6/NTAB) family NADH-FMN oxidoreductase RutF